MDFIPGLTLVLVIVLLVLVILLYLRSSRDNASDSSSISALGTLVSNNLREGREAQLSQLRTIDQSLNDKIGGMSGQLAMLERRLHDLTAEITQNLGNIQEGVNTNLQAMRGDNNQKLDDMRKVVDENLQQMLQDKIGGMSEQMAQVERRLHGFTTETTQGLENIRAMVDKNLHAMREDNSRKLDDMRKIVDEKLQQTLTERMNQSFQLVNERLEQVYKGLGEMQTLAQGVGDLKKVLSNVKTRGIVGEIQLGAILQDILAPEQYEVNVATVPGSRNVVEFAVKLPVEDGGFVYLPIDSKFPGDTYAALQDAYMEGTRERIDACAKQLTVRMKEEAKDIHDKYLAPPYTTEFAILFLPFEGLYAEAVNRGMVEVLQRDYHVNLAGPSTMAALLNSLQMAFRTIAIQKRSGEVWNVLGAVKTEFEKFESCLTTTQTRLDQASRELDKLIGVRTRAIRRKLRGVSELSEDETRSLLGSDEDDFGE